MHKKLEPPLYTLLQTFSLTLFDKMPINELFINMNYNLTSPNISNKLNIREYEPNASDPISKIHTKMCPILFLG